MGAQRLEGDVWEVKGKDGQRYYFGRVEGKTRRISKVVYLTVLCGGLAPLSAVLWAEKAHCEYEHGTEERERACAILRGGSGDRVTIRPNLNTEEDPQTSVHKGTLGRKVDSAQHVSILLTGSVIRPSGERTLKSKGKKTVYAGLIGYRVPVVPIPVGAEKIRYNPHIGDGVMHVNGGPLPLGSIITSDGWRYFVARPPEGRSQPLETVMRGFLDNVERDWGSVAT